MRLDRMLAVLAAALTAPAATAGSGTTTRAARR